MNNKVRILTARRPVRRSSSKVLNSCMHFCPSWQRRCWACDELRTVPWALGVAIAIVARTTMRNVWKSCMTVVRRRRTRTRCMILKREWRRSSWQSLSTSERGRPLYEDCFRPDHYSFQIFNANPPGMPVNSQPLHDTIIKWYYGSAISEYGSYEYNRDAHHHHASCRIRACRNRKLLFPTMLAGKVSEVRVSVWRLGCQS